MLLSLSAVLAILYLSISVSEDSHISFDTFFSIIFNPEGQIFFVKLSLPEEAYTDSVELLPVTLFLTRQTLNALVTYLSTFSARVKWSITPITMAYILRGFVKMYYYLNEEIADPRTQDWPLMRTPWPGLFVLSLYLMAVFKWLPNHMNQRPAYDLRRLIAAYNFIQILFCVYVVYYSLTLGWLNHYSLICQPVDEGANNVEYAWKVCYAYFIIKLIDLIDTIFFVLRKKQNQVTFLHVYHHFGMVAVAWGIVKWVPGGHITMVILINSVVHIIMYSYYLLTTWDQSYKRSLWWKKYVTQIQIVQFSIVMIHLMLLLLAKDCNYPKQTACILIPQNLFMFILFCDFYYRSYIKPKKN